MPYIGQRPATGESNSFKILDEISSYTLTFDGSSAGVVSLANDTITEREHRFVTGQRVTYNDGGGTAITGLSDGIYYIIVEDKHTFKLASSANNAASGTAINLTGLGVGASHTLNVAFDGVNTKFKATINNGDKAGITASGQLMLSINGVLQEPHDNTTSPTTGYATDHTSTIIFSAAPAATDQFFGRLIASNFATFDISDNAVDNFTGDGSTSTFTLSKSPANNESILVTIDGVVQYPDDNAATRAYSVSENILDFASAPGSAVEIQVRHIGFAGAQSAGITGFYGRTGNAALKSTDDIVFNDATASGTVEAANVTVTGNLTVNGTTTTLDTELTSVDKLEVAANNTTVAAAITQTGTGDILNLYDGAAEVFTVTDGGKVGVGQASPTKKLEVAGGAVSLSPDTAGKHTHEFTTNAANDGRYFIKSDTTTKVDIQANGATYFNGGNFGIGNNNPREKLDVSAGRIILDQDYQFTWANGTTNRARIYGDGGNNFIVENGSSNTERLRITSAGKVGIGTDNPSDLLDVFKKSSTAYDPTDDDAQRNDGASITVRNDDGTTNSFAQLVFDTAGSNQSIARIVAIRSGSGSNDLTFVTEHSNTKAERLRITSAGNIGIGTDVPAELLHLNGATNKSLLRFTSGSYGTASTDGSHVGINFGGLELWHKENNYLRFGTNNTERLRITSDGNLQVPIGSNIEIGQTASSGHANGNAGSVLLGIEDGGGAMSGVKVTNVDAGTYNDQIITFLTAQGGVSTPTERLRVTSAGRIGIGTATPDSILALEGTGSDNATRITIKDGTGIAEVNGRYGNLILDSDRDNAVNGSVMIFQIDNDEKVRITSGGKFGIGTVNPQEQFVVSNSGAEGFEVSAGVASNVNKIVNYNRSGGSYSSLRIDAAEHIFRIGASDALRIDSAGKVLIGKTSGSFALDIERASANTIRISNSGESTHGDVDAKIVAGGTYYQNMAMDASSFKFSTYNGSSVGERLRITSAGDISIGGLSSPRAKLDIDDAGTGKDVILRVSADDNNPYGLVVANDSFNTTSNRGLAFWVGANKVHHISARTSTTGSENALSITAGADTYFTTGGAERLRITSGGQHNFKYVNNQAPRTYANGSHEGLIVSVDRDDNSNFLGTIDFAAGRASDNTNGGTQFRFFTQPRSAGAAAAERLRINRHGCLQVGEPSGTPSEVMQLRKASGDVEVITYAASGSKTILNCTGSNRFALERGYNSVFEIQDPQGNGVRGDLRFDGNIILNRNLGENNNSAVQLYRLIGPQNVSLASGMAIVGSQTDTMTTKAARITTSNSNGTAWFGPYGKMHPGSYTAMFHMKVSNNSNSSTIIRIDVSGTGITDAGGYGDHRPRSLDLAPSHFDNADRYQYIGLDFNFVNPVGSNVIEVRGLNFNNSRSADLYLDHILIVPRIPSHDG